VASKSAGLTKGVTIDENIPVGRFGYTNPQPYTHWIRRSIPVPNQPRIFVSTASLLAVPANDHEPQQRTR